MPRIPLLLAFSLALAGCTPTNEANLRAGLRALGMPGALSRCVAHRVDRAVRTVEPWALYTAGYRYNVQFAAPARPLLTVQDFLDHARPRLTPELYALVEPAARGCERRG